MPKSRHEAHKARKRFGQNFLTHEGVIHHIIRAIAPKPDDAMVEIGPGKGAITASLLSACNAVHVIELDRDLVPLLKIHFATYSGLTIHQADALSFDFEALGEILKRPLRVVGNLPYNISTPLIFHLLSSRLIISDMHFMLQKEVVLRLAASPGHKNYGRLSVMAQYQCDVSNLFEVPPEAFHPAPKVVSAIVRMTPRKQRQHEAVDEKHFADLVKMAFSQRRKTLRNTLKPMLEPLKQSVLADINIDLSERAERLSVGDFVALSNTLSKLNADNHTHNHNTNTLRDS